MKVVTFIHNTDNLLDRPATRLFLNTIRTGFPTWPVEVYFPVRKTDDIIYSILQHAIKSGLINNIYPMFWDATHATFIKTLLHTTEGGLVVIDQDMIFYGNCEEGIKPGCFRGMYIPKFLDPYSGAITMPRLHTSFLYIRDCQKLCRDIKQAIHPDQILCPSDLFSAQVMFYHGEKRFYDVCANLYHAISGDPFMDYELDLYTHLHAGHWVDKIAKVGKTGVAIRNFQIAAIQNPDSAKGAWRQQMKWYEEQSIK